MDLSSWASLVRQWQGNPRLAAILSKTQMSLQIDTAEGNCYLLFSGGSVEFYRGYHIRPDFILAGDTEAIDGVLRSRTDITHPVSRGQLRVVKGKFLLALSLSRLFARLREDTK